MNKVIMLILVVVFSLSGFKNIEAKMRVGVYDSRMVAVWYYNSTDYRNSFKTMMEEMKKAKESNNIEKQNELNGKGELLQRIAHDKSFGTGSVAEILESRKEEIAKLAKTERMDIIVSKWELNFSNKDLEIIDITEKLLKQFGADEKIMGYYKDMKNNLPIKNALLLDPRK